MTNKFITTLRKLAKILLIFFLLFIGLVVLVMFLKFSKVEKRLDSQDIDYTRLLDPNYESDTPVTNSDAPITNKANSQLITGDGSNYSLGTDHPKITIVEFADFACPYCKKSFPTIREISLKYNKNVKYIFRDLPIISEYSTSLALAARCAGEQGLFWPMHDRLFINQGIKEESEILLAAKQSGVDISKFQTCFDSQKYLPQIEKDYSDAKLLNIDHIGTPVWFINGQQVAGNIPENIFDKLINDILNN